MVFGGFAGAVTPQSGQRYKIVIEEKRPHTFFFLGRLLAGGERGVWDSWI